MDRALLIVGTTNDLEDWPLLQNADVCYRMLTSSEADLTRWIIAYLTTDTPVGVFAVLHVTFPRSNMPARPLVFSNV